MTEQASPDLPGGMTRPGVLVVDDQPGKLLTYQAILDRIDAEIVMSGSAREALDQLLHNEFAVVIVDVCMPELDGFELASLIREHPRCRRTAIIFVSGVHLSEFDRLKGYEVGAVDYLPVPIVPEILRAKVNVFLDLYRKTCELESLNRQLEQRVAERTAELERAGRQKDEFLAVLAHELRNPLAAIRSAAHIMATPETPASLAAKSTAVIHRQVGQLVRLIDDLVDVSRITRGIVELSPERIAIGDVIEHALEASRPLVDSRGHILTVDAPHTPLFVHGDMTRLTQVLTNVINNAAKFTDPGGHIVLSAAAHEDDVILRVSDTGIGIAEEMIPHVLELFTQGQPLLDRTSSGLGIGLALVQRLVTMHGGQVNIASAGLGRGTTVSITLPLSEPAGRDKSPAALPAAGGRVEPLTARILVVDDNVDAADALAVFLRLSGHDVLTADDGVEALRVGPSFAPDVILLDLGMPRLNGFDTARRLRQLPWGRHVSLIALSGWGQQQDQENTVAAGFDTHLVKPVGENELMEALARAIELRTHRTRVGRADS